MGQDTGSKTPNPKVRVTPLPGPLILASNPNSGGASNPTNTVQWFGALLTTAGRQAGGCGAAK